MASAVAHGMRLADEGADIIDVGGESTRPGAEKIAAAEQLKRIEEVIQQLHENLHARVPISVDTTLPEVAERALDAGASAINDVSAGAHPDMIRLAADRQVPIVLMHMQGSPGTMHINPQYEDVVAEVESFLLERVETAMAGGVDKAHIVIDPGIGFGKTCEHNLALLANLARLTASGYPVLLGTSRKRFMAGICAEQDFNKLAGATCATTTLGVLQGVRVFRVHDVRPNRQAADVAWTLKNELRV